MLETITVAMNAERDAHIRAKLAEHGEAMHALMRARDEENAALMRARDEDTTKIAELVKTLKVKPLLPVSLLALQASMKEAQQTHLGKVSQPPAAPSYCPSFRLILVFWPTPSPYSSSATS